MEQLALDDPEALDALMVGLQQKKLVRIVGAEPEQVYMLTDRAAQSLNPKP